MEQQAIEEQNFVNRQSSLVRQQQREKSKLPDLHENRCHSNIYLLQIKSFL